MRLTIVAVVVLATQACGGEEMCEKSSAGTYMATYSERAGGLCGPITDQLVTVPGESGGCIVKSKQISDDQCQASSTMTCAVPGTTEKMDTTTSLTTTPDGSRISGVMTATFRTSAGAVICISTYDVVMTRQ